MCQRKDPDFFPAADYEAANVRKECEKNTKTTLNADKNRK
jgi:hypothetical protein